MTVPYKSKIENQKSKIVIVGAGIGGLSAAIRLAAAGQQVVICEQNATVGGKMGEITAEGFRWDTGPSVITMRHVFAELFEAAGRRLEDYLTLQPVEPLTRYFWRDGTVLDATRNLEQMVAHIAQMAPEDVAGYQRFLAYAEQLHRMTGPVFIYNQPPTWRTLLQANPLDMLRIQPWLTMDQVICRYVRSTKLRQLLGRFATYVGASPYLAPATLSVIAHVELNEGVWYPQGGIYAIATALTRLAQELGVEIRTSSPVQAIEITQDAVTGVHLADGAHLAAAAVIANVDVTTVYEKLLPATVATPARRRQLTQRATSCSGYVLLLGVEGQHPQLAHHNIFFPPDYRREFDDIFQRGIPPTDPTVYVAITAKHDPTHAPPGCENWFVLVNAPPTGPDFDWTTQEAAYREQVLATLRHYGIDLRNKISYTKVLTPQTLTQLTGAWRGALYGISSNQALNAFRRPHNRSPHVGGLYFVGGTTHPGGGVPMVTLSGKVVAAMVQQDLL